MQVLESSKMTIFRANKKVKVIRAVKSKPKLLRPWYCKLMQLFIA